ncbi:hypothetical protein PFLmoz3_02489 [Pseudomonas fluorescens]|uniref:Uncharacterized protein n=1 Tax=Pseudomonas fluorescens TaxID=294 RepID=A0A109LI51_PSEFL|nr:hypothetical protein PFLmoz3_02489 [Pseudomonas fluorescens]
MLVVKAMAPNTPIGARRTIMPMMRKITWLNSLISREIPLAASPTRFSALPNSTENNSTCSTLLSAKAPTTELGINSIRNWLVPRMCWPLSASSFKPAEESCSR